MTEKTSLQVAQSAQQALLYEVVCLNKPGLVDPIDSGSHQDMDVFTFIQSSVVLMPFLVQFVETGHAFCDEPVSETFKRIRQIGMMAEQEMLKETSGINTHKGAIFSLGIFLAICGRLKIWEEPTTLDSIKTDIKKMTENILDDFKELETKQVEMLTWGERLYVTSGISGIRGEAYVGYPSILNSGLPYYQKHQGSQQEKLIDTLLVILFHIEDTTLIKRSHSLTIKETINPLIETYFLYGGSQTPEGRSYLQELNELFKEKNWSIGGSADALIVTVFLDLLIQKKMIVTTI